MESGVEFLSAARFNVSKGIAPLNGLEVLVGSLKL